MARYRITRTPSGKTEVWVSHTSGGWALLDADTTWSKALDTVAQHSGKPVIFEAEVGNESETKGGSQSQGPEPIHHI
jgi:hypothetical protein